MPFVLPLIWYIPYYLFFNLVFLIPMSLLIFIFQLILVFFFGEALLHKDLKCKAPLIEPNLRRNLGKWST
ncbi:hypothetical protein [Acinetobacter baumannii]|uniref:hypothetical protein n=1 Tax=Acinetobacter baumannii TaxID=470 RepID=UPI0038BA16D2